MFSLPLPERLARHSLFFVEGLRHGGLLRRLRITMIRTAAGPILLTPRPGTYTGKTALVKKFVSFKMERLGRIWAEREQESPATEGIWHCRERFRREARLWPDCRLTPPVIY
jgi:hypothetical protein